MNSACESVLSGVLVRRTMFQLKKACEAASGFMLYKAVAQQHSSSFIGIPILLSSCT